MNAKDRRLYSEVCDRLALALRRLAVAGGKDLPFCPLNVAAHADAAATKLLPAPKLVSSK
ncbi:hypothetical protein AB9K35_15820 [Leisingera sp. XS_AS12]|uniref:hypothetical protein n=1 Tax=unclassified Leisingera TaxID=2614906 RepID=UPI003518DB9C